MNNLYYKDYEKCCPSLLLQLFLLHVIQTIKQKQKLAGGCKVKVKVKCALEEAMKGQRGSRHIALLFL